MEFWARIIAPPHTVTASSVLPEAQHNRMKLGEEVAGAGAGQRQRWRMTA